MRSFNKRDQGDWDGNEQPIRFTNGHMCPQELFACGLKRSKSRELEIIFVLFVKRVHCLQLSVFYFSAYKTELELKLKLRENLVQILGQ